MKKLSLICLAMLAVFTMASCRGPKGDPGNANVASSTVTINDYDWEWVRIYSDAQGNERGQYMVTIDYPDINSNVFNYGAVLVYMDVRGTWSQLPMTYYYPESEGNDVYLYEASIEVETLDDGAVRLFWTESDLWKVCPDTHRFKIVAIEASVYDHRSDVDYSNYEAVKNAFQIAD